MSQLTAEQTPTGWAAGTLWSLLVATGALAHAEIPTSYMGVLSTSPESKLKLNFTLSITFMVSKSYKSENVTQPLFISPFQVKTQTEILNSK